MKVVFKLGGSIFAPKKIDTAFLKKLVSKIFEFSQKNEIAIVVGGGSLSREYDKLGRIFTQNEDLLDLIGIFAARLNAALLTAALGKNAAAEIPRNEKEFLRIAKKSPGKIIVAGGFRPRQRTDAVAVEIAKAWHANLVIKGTDVPCVYDKDPKKYKNAKPIKNISYEELLRIARESTQRANKPVIMDLEGAKILRKNRIKLAVVSGSDLANLQKVFEGKEFRGTRVGF